MSSRLLSGSGNDGISDLITPVRTRARASCVCVRVGERNFYFCLECLDLVTGCQHLPWEDLESLSWETWEQVYGHTSYPCY